MINVLIRNITLKNKLLLVCLTVSLVSCGKEKTSDTKLIAFSDTLWPKTGSTYVIPVCFEEGPLLDDGFRDWTRGIVRDTWEYYSLVRFIGWNNCTPNEHSVRIKLTTSSEKESTPQVGRRLLGSHKGIEIPIILGDKIKNQISAMHMFGHILGFSHEHLRNEKCPDRLSSGVEFEGDLILTNLYDHDSIMNFCREDSFMGRKLSTGDIIGLQSIYGK